MKIHKKHKKGIKSKIIEDKTTKEVVWKITYHANLRPESKSENDLNLIQKLQMKRSQLGHHWWRFKN